MLQLVEQGVCLEGVHHRVKRPDERDQPVEVLAHDLEVIREVGVSPWQKAGGAGQDPVELLLERRPESGEFVELCGGEVAMNSEAPKAAGVLEVEIGKNEFDQIG